MRIFPLTSRHPDGNTLEEFFLASAIQRIQPLTLKELIEVRKDDLEENEIEKYKLLLGAIRSGTFIAYQTEPLTDSIVYVNPFSGTEYVFTVPKRAKVFKNETCAFVADYRLIGKSGRPNIALEKDHYGKMHFRFEDESDITILPDLPEIDGYYKHEMETGIPFGKRIKKELYFHEDENGNQTEEAKNYLIESLTFFSRATTYVGMLVVSINEHGNRINALTPPSFEVHSLGTYAPEDALVLQAF